MAEQFREEPKKEKLEAGKQETPDAVKSPEMPVAERKIIENKRTADKALDLLFDAYNGTAKERFSSRDTSEDPLVSSGNVAEWRDEIKKALVERKGSRISNKENPDLVEPLVLLAEKAFGRNDPNTTPDADNKRLRETAFKTVQALFERYPDRLDPNALNRGQFDRLLETTGRGLERAGLRDGYADTLIRIGRDVGKEDPHRLIHHLDGTIESITKKLAIDAYDDATVNVDQEGAQAVRRSDVAKILPSLKELMQLREAMSQRLLGKEIPPDDVLKIVSIKDALEDATTPEKGRKPESVPQTPERPARTFNDVKSELNAAPIKTIAEAMVEAPALVTAEVKKAILENVLREIDGKINQAKQLNRKLGANIIGNLLGITADAKVYALPYLAGGGRGLPRGVKVVDYMKTAFGYDLPSDSKRAAELKQWTDMLD